MKSNSKSIHTNVLLLILCIVFILSSCRNSSKSGNETQVKPDTEIKSEMTLADSLETKEKSCLSNPIGHSEYNQIIGFRYQAFDIGPSMYPFFIDPVINAIDLYKYIENVSAGNFAGIRVYPGLTDKDHLVLILCAAKSENDVDESLYKILEYGNYTARTDAINNINSDPEVAKNLHKNYISKVRIFGENQPAYGSSDNSVRKSRYYEISKIKKFMTDNILGLILTGTPDFKDYKIKLEAGFVPSNLIGIFHTRHNVNNNPIYQYGFTTVWQILDINGVTVIDPAIGVDENDLNNYKNRALEVGSPCPPRCGVLHPGN